MNKFLIIALAAFFAAGSLFGSNKYFEMTAFASARPMSVTVDTQIDLTFDPSSRKLQGSGSLKEYSSYQYMHRIITVLLPDNYYMDTPVGRKSVPDGTVVSVSGTMSARRGFINQNGGEEIPSILTVEIPLDESFKEYGAGEYALVIPIELSMQEAYGSYSAKYEFTPWNNLIEGQEIIMSDGNTLDSVQIDDPIVEIPGDVISVSPMAFYSSGCREVTIPMQIVSASGAFEGSAVDRAIWDDGCQKVCAGMFKNAVNLSEIKLTEGMTFIEENAFIGCSSLESVSLPASMKTIGNYAFQDCSGMTYLEIAGDVTVVARTTAGSPFKGSGITEITVKSGVTKIPARLYVEAFALEGLNLPDTVSVIGSRAFDGANNVTVYYEGNESGWKKITRNGFMPAEVVYAERVLESNDDILENNQMLYDAVTPVQITT